MRTFFLLGFYYFLLIIKSKPKFVFSERTSFFNIPFLNKLIIIMIDSRNRDKIENIEIMKLLIIELFFFIESF